MMSSPIVPGDLVVAELHGMVSMYTAPNEVPPNMCFARGLCMCISVTEGWAMILDSETSRYGWSKVGWLRRVV